MRILIATTSRGWGGMEIYPVRLAAALGRAGHEVRLACRPGSEIDHARAASGIPAIRLAPGEVAALAPDILDVHHPRDLPRALVLLGWLGRGRPVAVFTKHTASPPGTRKRDPYHRLVARWFDGFVTASRFVAEGLGQAYGIGQDRIHVVPYGYDPPRPAEARDAAARVAVRADLGIPPGRRVVGCVAQLSRGKYQHVLVEALRMLVARGRDAQVLLVGGEVDAGYRGDLVALARERGVGDRVTFLGERRDVGRLLAALDLLVLPSRAESFGIVILEAWSAGVPVVATAAGGVGEFVRDGESGLLVPPGDSSMLVDAIEGMLAAPGLGASLGAAGRRAWVDRHTMALAVARTVEAYEAIAAGRAHRAPA